jgi:predicted ATP-dependent protease
MRQHSADAEWHQRMLEEGIYDITTDGEMVGTVNALTVVQIGPLGFGRPCRVSAMVSAGDESMSNIERDVDLAGSIYNKGMHMVVNFLRWRYGQEKPIPARMSLVFDQSYGPIDGDSASSTEVYAVLSELTGFPVRNDLAVTGAINMKGDVLAIGGINEKIEGFFNLCAARGLTGTQGILLPKANVEDLMLPPDVVAAIRAGKFHLYEVEHVDQGIALLTGKSIQAVSKAVAARLEKLSSDDESKSDSKDGTKSSKKKES